MIADLLESAPWLVALLVFGARVCDVSLATVRTIMIFRGLRRMAACIGFFEVLVWLCAVGAVLPHLDRWYLVLAYAAGFATGNIVGIAIEGKLALGHLLVRTISTREDIDLAEQLRAAGFSVVEVPGTLEGERQVEVLFLVERRRRARELLECIEGIDPEAVTTVTDVKEHRLAGPGSAGGRPRMAWIDSIKRK